MTQWKYRKRAFLSSISTGYTSHILAEVESTRNGEYKWGNSMLTIADCKRSVQLEFFLGTKRARKQSFAKLKLLLTTIQDFQNALITEAELIERVEKSKKGSKK